jgi:hypothetical protein
MLVAVQRYARQWGVAATGVALVAVIATAMARGTEADPAPPTRLSTLDLDRGEYNIGDAPNVTVRVEPITAAPAVDVEANLFFSETPDPLVTSILPSLLMGVIPNGDGELTLELDAITCFSPQLFLQGTITDPDTGTVFEITNDVLLLIDYNQGVDPAGVPDCVFIDIDIDGDGEPDFEGDPPGGEGCPAGFWKGVAQNQPEQFPLPLRVDSIFGEIFEDAFPGSTLQDVLTSPNSPLQKLGKETVAALLNAQDARVDYDLSVAEVITLFNDVFPGSNTEYLDLKEFFKVFNNQGGSGHCTDFRIELDPAGAVSTGGKRR